MASEGGPLSWFHPGWAAVALVGGSLLLGALAFFVGWFTVDTKATLYQEEDGEQGAQVGVPVRVTFEMRMLTLDTAITPSNIDDTIRNQYGYPSYDEEAGNTGTSMLGVLFLHLTTFVALVATGGFYWWNRRSRRDLARAIWRFGTVFGALALVTLLYMGFTTPSAADDDVDVILKRYAADLSPPGAQLDPSLVNPEIAFWNTWEDDIPIPVNTNVCPCIAHVKTVSRPSSGFWLEGISLLMVGVGLFLARSAGHLEPKPSPAPAPEAAPPPPRPKAA